MSAEIYTFNRIRTETSLRAPEIIATNEKDYVICDWLEGENTGFKIEEGDRKQEMAEILGKALAEIHSVQYQKFGELNQNGVEDSYNKWKNFVENLIEFLKGFDTPEIADKGIKYLEDNLDEIEGDYQPVLIHGDYHAWNTVINENDRLGVLDCEASFVGCREYEITRAMGHWTEEHSISEEFIKAYGKDKLKEDWRTREDY
ncbi:MAG: phosphotransferase family protein [Candidatus Nanohaloarchaea archaeon]